MKFLLASLLLLTAIHFKGDAQTKEETIAWINEKVSKYGARELSYCENGNTYWTQSIRMPNGSNFPFFFRDFSCPSSPKYSTMIHYNRITKAWIRTVDGCEPMPTIVLEGRFLEYVDGKETFVSGARFYLPWDSETDLLNRMIKAFNHLAELTHPATGVF